MVRNQKAADNQSRGLISQRLLTTTRKRHLRDPVTGWDFISPAFLSICAWRIYPKGDSDLCYPRTWQEAGVDVVWESQRHTDADWAIIEVAPRRWRAFLVAITSNGEANA